MGRSVAVVVVRVALAAAEIGLFKRHCRRSARPPPRSSLASSDDDGGGGVRGSNNYYQQVRQQIAATARTIGTAF
jgi:hypothetical protein